MSKLTKCQRAALRLILTDLGRVLARLESSGVVITAPSEGKGNCIKNTDPDLAKLNHSVNDLSHFIIYN